ncbi:uncharacterized protein [Diadema antillarum]|uniref:uncharacterized protein n=1 Tax=Diadema antillarum TaxID=105358 RepID=UPI003A89C5A9
MSSAGESTDSGTRVIMWCVPRSVSSALTKCLSAIQGTEIYFEPYTVSYQANRSYKRFSGGDIPKVYEGNEEAFDTAARIVSADTGSYMDPKRLAYASVKKMLETSSSKHVFVKDMGSGVADDNFRFLPEGYQHTFLIRNPIRFINSYRRGIYIQYKQLGLLKGEAANERTFDVECDDKNFPHGFYMKEPYDIWKYVSENIDGNPIVIDADDLLAKPAAILSAYCSAVGLPYSESLLKWDASTESVKSRKAAGDNFVFDLDHFFSTAARSSEFLPASKFPPRESLTPDVIRGSERVMKYFDEMYESRLTV